MMKYKNPPTLQVFSQVYIEALDRLDGKIKFEKEKLEDVEESNQKINYELENIDTLKSPSKKQFVFRVIELINLDCESPIFDIQTDGGHNATVNFSDFQHADIIIDLTQNDRTIKVTIIHNITNTELFFFEIDSNDYMNKKRAENRAMSEGINGIEVYYEGQLIFDRVDYLKELISKNNLQEEDFKENIFELSNMKEEIQNIFPRLNLIDKQQNNENLEKTKQMQNSMNLRQSIVQTSLDPNNLGMFKTPEKNYNPKNEIPLNPFEKQNKDFISDRYRPLKTDKKDIKWHKFLFYIFILNCILFIISIFINWDRTSFMSLVVSSIFIIWFYLKNDFEIYIPEIGLLISYCLCFFFDLIWLIMASKELWVFDYYFNDNSLKGLDKFIVILSYIIIFVELCLVVLCVFVFREGIYDKHKSVGKKKEVKILF